MIKFLISLYSKIKISMVYLGFSLIEIIFHLKLIFKRIKKAKNLILNVSKLLRINSQKYNGKK